MQGLDEFSCRESQFWSCTSFICILQLRQRETKIFKKRLAEYGTHQSKLDNIVWFFFFPLMSAEVRISMNSFLF